MWMLLEPETRSALDLKLDRIDRWLYPLYHAFSAGVGSLQNVRWIGRLSETLFGWLSARVWGWSHLPLAQRSSDLPLQRDAEALLANWSASVQTRPARVAHPSSTRELAEILLDENQFPSPVRPMGCYHSTTPCSSADGGTILRFDRFKRVLEIGPDFVETEPGALYVDVAHELHRRGLEFYVNLQIGNITMAAAACSTTKDGAFPGEYAQASSYCTAMTLVLADGSTCRIDEQSTPELMQVARCSHGLLGVVCAVRFRVRRIEPVSIEHRNMSVEQFLRELPALKDCGGSIEYYLYPFLERVTVQIRRKSDAGGEANRWVWKLRNFNVSRVVPLAAHAIEAVPGRALRDGVSALFYRVASRGLQWVCRAKRTYASGQTTRYRQPPGRLGFSFGLWGFAEADFPQALRDYIALTKRHYAETGYRSHMLTVGYVVSPDTNALLSYSWSGRTITIDPTGFAGKEWDRFLDAYNDFCCEHGGIPLLNQTPRLTASHVRRAFGERLARFEEVRRKFDPENRLLNPYFEQLLQET